MEKEEAKKLLNDIKNECISHKECNECPFYIGKEYSTTLCIFSAEDEEDYDIPANWPVDALPNL